MLGAIGMLEIGGALCLGRQGGRLLNASILVS